MKVFVLIVAYLAACSAKVIDPNAGYVEGNRYIFFPDGEGIPHLVDLEEEIDINYLNSPAIRNANNNQYWLYTRNNPTDHQMLHIYDAESVYGSNYNPQNALAVIVHGWNSNGRSSVNTLCTRALLETYDMNVIVVDWRALANRNYITAKNGVSVVGRGVGQFINFLVSIGAADLNRVHLIGFSLGAHIVGNAGAETGGRVRRITGLDPAGPLFRNDNSKLASSHAQFVEAIHTSSNLGYNDVLADMDVFPNGGSSMPGCLMSTCSHSKAYEYFAATITYNHLHGNQCDSVRNAKRGRCTGPLHPMGNGDYTKTGSGIYHVTTGRNYPY